MNGIEMTSLPPDALWVKRMKVAFDLGRAR